MLNDTIIWFKDLGIQDIDRVGGKNASLGEMIQHLTSLGIQVPQGFATTAKAYQQFLAYNHLEEKIKTVLDSLDVGNLKALSEAGKTIRQWILNANIPSDLAIPIKAA